MQGLRRNTGKTGARIARYWLCIAILTCAPAAYAASSTSATFELQVHEQRVNLAAEKADLRLVLKQIAAATA